MTTTVDVATSPPGGPTLTSSTDEDEHVGWVVAGLVWVGLGVLTSRVAAGRGHDRVLWLVLGLVFPGAALAALLLGYPRIHTPGDSLAPDVREALQASRVAAALVDHDGVDEGAVRAATGLPRDRVVGELRTLRLLGLVRRRRDRTWSLTPRAAAVLAEEPEGS